LRRTELKSGGSEGGSVSVLKSLFGSEFWRATWVCAGLGLCVQLTAIGPTIVFSTTIVKKIETESQGSFPITPQLGTLIVGIVNFAVGCFAPFPMAKFGRRTILIWGHIAMCICQLLIGIFVVTK
jgi:hypothetical protein